MTKPLTKTLSAGLLAFALAVTGMAATTAPASANGHRHSDGAEAAAVLGGLLLLYGIANSRNGNVTIRQNGPRHGHRFNGHAPRNLRVAPSRCYVEGRNGNHVFRGYVRRCMQNNVSAPHLLPASCLRQVYTNRGQRMIYGGRCLANNGWVRG